MTSHPGLRYKWYVFPRIIRAPAASSSSGDTDFTEPLVPTGIKTGVSITPWAVWRMPALAREVSDFEMTLKSNISI
jgi:hypothetical protein